MTLNQTDVIVAGAGMVGGALAALLSRSGFSVAVIDAHEPPPFNADAPVGLRVSAISPGSIAVLEQTGAWKRIVATRACDYSRMHVEDRSEAVTLEFDAPAFGLDRLGAIVENELIRARLWQLLESSVMVELCCPASLVSLQPGEREISVTLDDGREIVAPLLVAADGAGSSVRTLAGIDQQHWEYNQKGVVTVVETHRRNHGVAWQRFLDGGPLAFLPLSNGMSSIVWTRPLTEADRLLALDDDAFLAELEQASGAWLDGPKRCGPRGAFPLSMRLSDRYVGARIALVGDAAHVVHPMAGQGVNLGFADAAALTEVLIELRRLGKDPGEAGALSGWDRWRRSESEMMARGVHAIRDLFSPDALAPLRRIGLGAVSRSWLLKDAFLKRATGQAPNAPRLCRGDGLSELLRG